MTVLRLAIAVLLTLSTTFAGAEVVAIPPAKIIIPPEKVKQLMSVRCQPCHFELKIKPSLLLNTNKWFRMTGEQFEIERRVFMEQPPHSMPMGSLLEERERSLLRNWFKQLHQQP